MQCARGLRSLAPRAHLVLTYETAREVRLVDRRLGLLYYVLMLSVFLYVVVDAFMINQRHLENEKSMGWALCRIHKAAYSGTLGLPWDVYDSLVNSGEVGAAFIPTRLVVTRGQTQDAPGCTSWCPVEDPKASTSEVHLLDFKSSELQLQTFVHFHRFGADVSTADNSKAILYPRRGANTLVVDDLLRLAGLRPSEVSQEGAVMILNVNFVCNMDVRGCDTVFETANVDTQSGFNHVYNHYYVEGGVRKRDSFRMYGIRVGVSATGFGSRMCSSKVLLQLSFAMALITLARNLADFILQSLLPERRHYIAYKVTETEPLD